MLASSSAWARVNLGSEDTSAPYSVSWDTTTVATAATRSPPSPATRRSDDHLHSVTVTVSNSAGPPPGAGLVAAYGFDAGSGSTAADSSGKGNVGSVSGPVWSGAGRLGSALSFDGVNDWVSVPDCEFARSDNGDDGGGVGAAVGAGRLADGGVQGAAGWGRVWAVCGSGRRRPLGEVFIGSERNATGTAALPLNAWSHLATTYDGSFVRLYVNGVLASSTAVTGAMAASTGVLDLGGNVSGASGSPA